MSNRVEFKPGFLVQQKNVALFVRKIQQRDLEPFSRLTNRLAPPGVPTGTPVIMGEIACPPPAAGGSTPPNQVELGRMAAPDRQNGG